MKKLECDLCQMIYDVTDTKWSLSKPRLTVRVYQEQTRLDFCPNCQNMIDNNISTHPFVVRKFSKGKFELLEKQIR